MTSPDRSDIPGVTLRGPALGEGRTSRVWRGALTQAFDGLEEGTAVAIKVLRPELAKDAAAIDALRHEREASRAVHHPALARARFLCPTGPAPAAAPGEEIADAGAARPWLLLDLVPGISLDRWIARDGALPEPIVRRLGARLARALAAMHAAGWVHGDVKPENVRLDEDGRAVLVDLGFARRAGAADAPIGTPGYVAPERTGGGPPVASADLFALGCLLFEACTGEPAARDEETLDGLRSGRLRQASSIVPRVSPLMDAVITELVFPSPAARPSAHELARALEDGEASDWWRSRLAFDPGARRDTVAWSGQHGLPLAGRERELDELSNAWLAVARGGAGAAVLLTGERGAGKSRLVTEFVHRLRRGAHPALYLYGRCNAIGDDRPAAPLIQLLRRWLHLPSGVAPGPRATELLEDTVSAEVARTLLATLQPEDAGAAAREMTEAVALGEWLAALGSSTPTVVFLDDIQFAGEATLGALRILARSLAELNILLILGLRRQADVRDGSQLHEIRARLAPRTTRIEVGPLSEEAVLSLVEELFHHAVPRLRLARVLHERTGGIPGNIGEVLRLAARKGMTRPARAPSRGLELLVRPDELPRPASLRVAVGERLAALCPRARIWLERAAAAGSRIDPTLVEEAWPRASPADLDAALTELTREGWIVAVGPRYRFAHPIEREETLDLARPRALARAHARIAAAIAAREEAAGRAPSYRRAFHLRRAGDGPGMLAVLPGLLERMRTSGHPQRLAALAGWGLEALENLPLAERDGSLERLLLEALADAADRLGARDKQRDALEALGELDLDLEAEPEVAAHVYVLHARHAVSGGRFGLARGFAKNAETLAETAAVALATGRLDLDPAAANRLRSDRAEVARLLAWIDAERGDYERATENARRALDLAPDALARARAHLVRSEVEIHEGRLDTALRRLASARRELRASPAPGLAVRAARAATNLLSGRAYRLVGRPVRAIRALERAAELSVQAGEGRIEVEVTARLGRLMADVGRDREADLMLRDALFMARRIEDRRGEALAALLLGIFLAEKATRGAADLVRRARRLAGDLGLGRVEALALAVEARIAREDGDLDGARRLASDAETLVERHGAELPDRIVIGGTLALIESELGNERAAKAIERTLRGRIEHDGAQLGSRLLRQRHRRWTVSLLAAALSGDGVLYPRVPAAR